MSLTFAALQAAAVRYALIPPDLGDGQAFSAWLYTTAGQAMHQAAADPPWRAVVLLPPDHHGGAVLFAAVAGVDTERDDFSVDATAHTTLAGAEVAAIDANAHCCALRCPPCWTIVAVHPLPGSGR